MRTLVKRFDQCRGACETRLVFIRREDTTEVSAPLDSLVMRALVTAAHGAGTSVTWVRLAGPHRRLRTDRSARVYYVLEGSAAFVLGDEPPIEARAGDVVVVPRGVPYEFEGDMTYLVINAPPFVEGDDVYGD
jgi:mannose-6-phosphate isomerase-like protein (cupin superfamily)